MMHDGGYADDDAVHQNIRNLCGSNKMRDDDDVDIPVVRTVEKKSSTKKDMMTNLFIIVAIVILILILYKLVSTRR